LHFFHFHAESKVEAKWKPNWSQEHVKKPFWSQIEAKSRLSGRLSHILINESPEAICTSNIFPAYHIGDTWYAGGEVIRTIPAPARLQVTYPLSTNIGISFNLGASGLFPQEELEKLQTIIQFPYQRQAIKNSIASRIGGHSQNDGFQTSRIFSLHMTNWFWSVSHFLFYGIRNIHDLPSDSFASGNHSERP